MRKAFILLLCMLLAGLCACRGSVPEETTVEERTTTFEIKTNPDDPFSYAIADVEVGDIWPIGRNWREDYALYDTDNQGTMALFLGIKNPDGFINEIYILQNGVAERVLSADNASGDCVITMYKTGVICTDQLDGEGAGGLYRFEDGQLKLIAGLGTYGDERGGYRVGPTGGEKDFFFDFIPDGTEVYMSADEFNGLIEELLGDFEPMELDWKPLAEYGR